MRLPSRVFHGRVLGADGIGHAGASASAAEAFGEFGVAGLVAGLLGELAGAVWSRSGCAP
jgi:hypothetical protein